MKDAGYLMAAIFTSANPAELLKDITRNSCLICGGRTLFMVPSRGSLNKTDSVWMTASHLWCSGVVNMPYYPLYEPPSPPGLRAWIAAVVHFLTRCYFGHQ
jgi:hypothetical protein